MPLRRAIGIVRVSRSSGRQGESFSSPQDQADRIHALAAQHGWTVTIPEPYEIDVSGDALLTDRPQLSRAVVAVQTGEADIIAAAHTERLWWNHETASQVIRLVEDANGEVWSADQGILTRRSAADEFSGTVRTAADRLSRRQNAEKSAAAIQRAINRGVPPWPRVTPGYQKRPDGTYEPAETAPAVLEAFRMRATGTTVREVRGHLQRHGIHLTYAGTVKLLKSRVVLGEIHFGDFTPNLAAHEAIVPRRVWDTVQATRVPSGRNTKSTRLLARLGVLICGTCSSKLVANTAVGAGGGRYAIYRCQNTDCERRVTISAPRAEETVVQRVREHLADLTGRASSSASVDSALESLSRAQDELDAAIRTLSVVGDEPATIERLTSLRATRDSAQDEVDRLSGLQVALRVNIAAEWERLTVDELRALIKANVRRAVVRPGRGDRIRVELFGE